MGYLRIGQLANLTSTSSESLRFYESKGLLAEPRRSEAGYRLYALDSVSKVNFILRAKRMGFSLKEVSELLSLQLDKEQKTCGEVKSLAEHKLVVIEEKIAELLKMRDALQEITDACQGGEESAIHCAILNALEG